VDAVSRFVAGLAAGLTLGLPFQLGSAAPHPHQPDAVERYVIARPTIRLPDANLDIVYGEIEGQEQCLIDWMEAEVGPGWDAVTVIAYLDRAWGEFDGPCDGWEASR
jgi:hypothetical protein